MSLPLPRKPLAAALDGISAIAVAAYLAAAIYRGNGKALGDALIADVPGFLEFLIALYLLSAIVNMPGPIGDISTGLVTLAIIVVIIRLMSGRGVSAFSAFGAGQITLFQLVQRLATGG